MAAKKTTAAVGIYNKETVATRIGNWVEEEALLQATGQSRKGKDTFTRVLSHRQAQSPGKDSEGRLPCGETSASFTPQSTYQRELGKAAPNLAGYTGLPPRQAMKLAEAGRKALEMDQTTAEYRRVQEEQQLKANYLSTTHASYLPGNNATEGFPSTRIPRGKGGGKIENGPDVGLTREEGKERAHTVLGPNIDVHTGNALTVYSAKKVVGNGIDFPSSEKSGASQMFGRSTAFTNDIKDPIKRHIE